MKPAAKSAPKTAKTTTATSKKSKGLTDEEIAAMKETLKERNSNTDGESAVLAKIAEMPEPDRTMAKRIHQIVKTTAPELIPRTWYGMPAYSKDDKVICFFQPGGKFKTRYSTFGFSDEAKLDDGRLWPTSFAVTELTPAEEARIVALVRKALG